MSKATKRKYVRREAVEDEVKPTGDQIIVKVTCGRGNNLHEVETCEGAKFLVSMPTKFRKSVWIKRGDFVVVEPIPEGHKVRAEIVHILYPMQIKNLKQQDEWPVEFSHQLDTPSLLSAPPTATPLSLLSPPPPSIPTDQEQREGDFSTEESSDEDLFQNTNHPQTEVIETSSSEESDY